MRTHEAKETGNRMCSYSWLGGAWKGSVTSARVSYGINHVNFGFRLFISARMQQIGAFIPRFIGLLGY